MTNKTQTISKAASKAAPKTNIKGAPKVSRAKAIAAELAAPAIAAANVEKAAKAAAKAATPAHAIIAMIVEGISKRIEAKSPFYATALAYHARNKTTFPRARNNETRAALKVEDVEQVFDQHDKRILAAGNAKGQAMFDVYMMQRS